MINIAKYSDLSKKKGLIDRVKKEDIKKDQLKERFGLDDGQINDLLELRAKRVTRRRPLRCRTSSL